MEDLLWEKAVAQYLHSLRDPATEMIEGNDFCFVTANCGIPWLNCVHYIRSKNLKSLERKLIELTQKQKRKKQSWSLILFPSSTPEGVRERVAQMKLDYKPLFPVQTRISGMRLLHEHYEAYARGKEIAQKMSSEDISFEYLNGDNSIEFARLQFEAHEVEVDAASVERYSSRLLHSDSQVQQARNPNVHMLLRRGKKVVTGGSYQMVEEGAVCIYELTTSVDERRRGYGSLLLEKLVGDAINTGGAHDVIVHCTETSARFFYTKGFVKFCDIALFTRNEVLHPMNLLTKTTHGAALSES
eukprot:gb/GECG01010376.1/.p1 GENE.gb/GECG01010376.1/~~gb/GECG01010376.1/.p1  ORF type:complete len:300 (+),score=32.80 gb/GECG01010376.1/:1-900(+)